MRKAGIAREFHEKGALVLPSAPFITQASF
jgi:hypothetical protein